MGFLIEQFWLLLLLGFLLGLIIGWLLRHWRCIEAHGALEPELFQLCQQFLFPPNHGPAFILETFQDGVQALAVHIVKSIGHPFFGFRVSGGFGSQLQHDADQPGHFVQVKTPP